LFLKIYKLPGLQGLIKVAALGASICLSSSIILLGRSYQPILLANRKKNVGILYRFNQILPPPNGVPSLKIEV
jgi:hypothetical protein